MSEQPTAPGQTDPRQFDVVLVDQSHDARMAARSEADARLTAELGQGGRFRRFISGIWKGNIAKDYYRHKYEQQALRHIEDTQDILIHESGSEARRDGAMYATIQRFQSDYEEMIHTDAGERRAEVTNDRITDGLKGIIRDYAEGRLDDTNLLEERARLLQAYRDERGDELLGEGTVQVDNLLDVARSVRGAVTHGTSLDDVIDGMRIITAESRAGVRTNVEYSRTDQVIEKLSKSKLGLIMGSEVTIAAASIAASVARFGSTRAVGAAAMTIAPGVGAGLLAGLREKKRVKDDRAQHARELAQGKSFNDDDTRRVEMEATRYETVLAPTVTAELRNYLEDDGLNGDDALQRALDSLAAIRAREHMSDTEGIDLIAYSAATAVEQERFDLALARAEVKVALRDRLDSDTRQRLSLDEHASVDELILATSDTFIETYQTDIDAKDQAFRKLRNRRVAKAAAQGVAVGLTLGIAGQEVGAALSSTREGLLEQAWGHSTKPYEGTVHETLLHGTFGGEPTAGQAAPGGELGSEATTKAAVGERGVVRYGDTLQIEEQDGRLVVGAADGSPVADVKLRPDGSLGDHAIAELRSQGVQVEDLSRTVMVETTETRTVGVDEFMQHHRADTTRITRDLWYDNDTAAPTFEANELGLHWGSENGSGHDGSGNILLGVSTMSADGSFHGAESTDWAQDARTDNLKLAISPTEGTQARPFLVDINPNGSINIPADSPAAQFFSVENGQTVFNGRYAEVVEMTGRDQAGVEHVRMLATLVGNDSAANVQDTFTTETPQLRPRYEFAMPVETAPVPDTFVEMAPVIPVVSRRSLEAVRRSETMPGYYGYDMTPEQQRRFRQEECSPRLNRDPRSRLRPREELSWRRQQIAARQGPEYLNQIDGYIDASAELSNLPAGTKAIVTIPVAAASEHDNIYKTLQSYAMQEGDLTEATVLLHVNWFDAPKEGKGVTQQEQDDNVRQTFAEIERARRDFPQLNIALMQTQWERARESRGEYGDGIIGHVARRMYDTAMMSIERQMRDGRLDGDADVLLIRNDSDAQGIQRTYLRNMIKAMQEHPENDVFTGAIRWGTERHRDLPGLGVVSNFREIMHILAARKGSNTWPPTVGINTAVRMSTFAAVGSVGDDPQRTGIGTDDYNIGGRIKDARQDVLSYGNRTYGAPLTARSSGPVGRSYGTRGLAPGEDFSYHHHVVGAAIDTAAERLERAYVNGVPIHDAWGDWDNTTRSEGLGAGTKDDLRSESGRNDLIAKVEHDISVAVSDRFLNRRQVMAGLAFQFPDPRYFRLQPVSGGLKFELTPQGRDFFINRLMRDSRGRFDPFGNRVRRSLYNETKPGARKQPLPKRPVMV